jgi:hypothetical protein
MNNFDYAISLGDLVDLFDGVSYDKEREMLLTAELQDTNSIWTSLAENLTTSLTMGLGKLTRSPVLTLTIFTQYVIRYARSSRVRMKTQCQKILIPLGTPGNLATGRNKE